MTTVSIIEKIILALLPYDYAALEPYISEQTLRYHHDKHMAAYVAKTNELVAGTPYENATLEDIITTADGPLFNNAAQVWNHEFYFAQFSPTPLKEPEGHLKEVVEVEYGGLEQLKEKMSKVAMALFGSGWVWLACDSHGKLHIVSSPNAGNPLRDGLYPLLAIDVWEHAYYIDHRNVRADGVKAFWQVLDWRVIDKRYDEVVHATKKQ